MSMKKVKKIISEVGLNEAELREQATYNNTKQDRDLREALSEVANGTLQFKEAPDIDSLLDNIED